MRRLLQKPHLGLVAQARNFGTIRAIVVLCPFLYANWSGPIADMRMGDNSMEEIHAMQVELIFDIIFIVHQIWHLPAHSLSPLQHGMYPNYQTTFHMRGESSSKP